MDYTAEEVENLGYMRHSNVSQNLRNQIQAYDILIPPIGTLIIVTNLVVIISSGLIIRKGQQPTCTYMFLGNVAMADFLTSMTVVMGQLYPKALITETMCTIQMGLIVSSTLTSNFSVALVAIDRFLYIIHGIKYNLWIFVSRAKLMIKFSWVLGIMVGFLPAFGWRNTLRSHKLCWYILIAPTNLIIITAVVGLFLPIFIVSALYSAILFKALKKVIQLRAIKKKKNTKYNKPVDGSYKAKPTSGNNSNIVCINISDVSSASVENISEDKGMLSLSKTKRITESKVKRLRIIHNNIQLHNRSRNPTKWKAIKVVMLTTSSFTCTWMPYFLASLIYVSCDPTKTPIKCKKLEYAIASPLAILGFFNSLLNPIIYAWWHNGFRTSLKGMCWRSNAIIHTDLFLRNKTESGQFVVTKY